MVRSGKLLVILLSAAALIGCTAGEPPTAAPTPTPTAERACADGLAEALRAHLILDPMGDRLPDDVVITEFPEHMVFASTLAESISQCVILTELLFGADRHFQIYGIVTEFDEAEIVTRLQDAGFEQTFPDAEPGAWATAEYDAITLYPDGSADGRPALGFPAWSDYLTPGDVVILGNITV